MRPTWTGAGRLLVALAVAVAAATAWAWTHLGMSFTVLGEGLGDVGDLLDRMLPPRFVDVPGTVALAVETFLMAYLATCIASVLSVPISVLAARNTTPHPAVRLVARGVIVGARAIPDVVFALIFVRAVGIGPLPGILAMSLHSIGMVGKLYADAVEQVDETPREAALSTGASPAQALVTAVAPQVLPGFVGTSLYRLDINLRLSVVLGLVGAGGIGFELQAALRQLAYARGLGIVCVIAVMVVLVELASAAIRRSIIGDDPLRSGAARRRSRPEPSPGLAAASASAPGAEPVAVAELPLRPPWTGERALRAGFAAALVALLAAALWLVDFRPAELVTELPAVVSTVADMFPPDFSTAGDQIRAGMTETLAIGLVATVLGIALTVPVGLASARNLAPGRVTYLVARTLVVLIRAVPELVLAIVFVAAIGLGPVPGVFALAVGTVGFMAKLMADGIEEIDPAPRDAVLSTGASRAQELATAVVPQAAPSFVANALYMLDVNIRTSAILGIVGAGGIGFLLNNSVRTLNLQTTSAILVVLFAVVYALELLAGWIRKRII